MAAQGKEIKSLREIYDLWVECNEKAYAELVYTDEYSELYGRLTNALLAVKQHQGKVMDKLLAKLNMPTRQGMNTVLKRVQEMKRNQSKMEREIHALRQLIEDKKSSPASSRAKTSEKKKSKKKVTKKKVSTKKKTSTKKKASTKKAAKKKLKSKKSKTSRNKSIVIDI